MPRELETPAPWSGPFFPDDGIHHSYILFRIRSSSAREPREAIREPLRDPEEMDAPARHSLQQRLHTRAGRVTTAGRQRCRSPSSTTTIVTTGKIFAPVRERVRGRSQLAGYWIRCAMCFGFPVGIFWCALGVWPGTGRAAADLLAAGAASSGWCWIMRVLLHRLGEDEL